jgi:hypothetical protein
LKGRLERGTSHINRDLIAFLTIDLWAVFDGSAYRRKINNKNPLPAKVGEYSIATQGHLFN